MQLQWILVYLTQMIDYNNLGQSCVQKLYANTWIHHSFRALGVATLQILPCTFPWPNFSATFTVKTLYSSTRNKQATELQVRNHKNTHRLKVRNNTESKNLKLCGLVEGIDQSLPLHQRFLISQRSNAPITKSWNCSIMPSIDLVQAVYNNNKVWIILS